jgi:hypothetical protein
VKRDDRLAEVREAPDGAAAVTVALPGRPGQCGLLGSSVLIGYIFGALSAGVLGELIGRVGGITALIAIGVADGSIGFSSIALTRPSIMGVSSGFWEGKATTVPLAKRRVATAESNNKVHLIPISFFSRAEEEEMKSPTPSRN